MVGVSTYPDSDYTYGRSSQEWLRLLEEDRDEEAIAELRSRIAIGLEAVLEKRIDGQPRSLAEKWSDEALEEILSEIRTFHGRSHFLTWAQKLAVRHALRRLSDPENFSDPGS